MDAVAKDKIFRLPASCSDRSRNSSSHSSKKTTTWSSLIRSPNISDDIASMDSRPRLMKWPGLSIKTGHPRAFATALTKNVFPLPGGPKTIYETPSDAGRRKYAPVRNWFSMGLSTLLIIRSAGLVTASGSTTSSCHLATIFSSADLVTTEATLYFESVSTLSHTLVQSHACQKNWAAKAVTHISAKLGWRTR